MMGRIPVLDDGQMKNLKRVVGAAQKIDLTSNKSKAPRRLPSDTEDTIVAASGGLKIGVIKSATVGGGPATIAEIILNADGTYVETGTTHAVIIPKY